MPHSRAIGDSQRQRPLGADIHHVRLYARMPLHETFDLIQGRDARRSGRAVFVEDSDVGPKQFVHVTFSENSSHRPSTTSLPFPYRVVRSRAQPAAPSAMARARHVTAVTVPDCQKKRQDAEALDREDVIV